eukprot:GEMP01004587.1.p1 GENE.GEMP01004587.1~~GEMP01004587.1.p1  ORF type:complete len:449 (+),score=114.12 GEMP01004587.1:1743-3089(+)
MMFITFFGCIALAQVIKEEVLGNASTLREQTKGVKHVGSVDDQKVNVPPVMRASGNEKGADVKKGVNDGPIIEKKKVDKDGVLLTETDERQHLQKDGVRSEEILGAKQVANVNDNNTRFEPYTMVLENAGVASPQPKAPGSAEPLIILSSGIEQKKPSRAKETDIQAASEVGATGQGSKNQVDLLNTDPKSSLTIGDGRALPNGEQNDVGGRAKVDGILPLQREQDKEGRRLGVDDLPLSNGEQDDAGGHAKDDGLASPNDGQDVNGGSAELESEENVDDIKNDDGDKEANVIGEGMNDSDEEVNNDNHMNDSDKNANDTEEGKNDDKEANIVDHGVNDSDKDANVVDEGLNNVDADDINDIDGNKKEIHSGSQESSSRDEVVTRVVNGINEGNEDGQKAAQENAVLDVLDKLSLRRNTHESLATDDAFSWSASPSSMAALLLILIVA